MHVREARACSYTPQLVGGNIAATWQSGNDGEGQPAGMQDLPAGQRV